MVAYRSDELNFYDRAQLEKALAGTCFIVSQEPEIRRANLGRGKVGISLLPNEGHWPGSKGDRYWRALERHEALRLAAGLPQPHKVSFHVPVCFE
jgi:hypothetical protein